MHAGIVGVRRMLHSNVRWCLLNIYILLSFSNDNVVDVRNTGMLLFPVDGWTTKPTMTTNERSTKTAVYVTNCNSNVQSRRNFVHQSSAIISSSTAAAAAIVLTATPLVSNAVSPSTSSMTTTSPATTALTDLQQRLPLGHARVKYLIDHWDEITSVCGTSVMSDIERKQVIRTEGGGGGSNGMDATCSKTPLRVQEFMGYKSTNDPLYKIDKLLIRVGSSGATNFMNSEDYNDFIDTVEQYRTTADATALLAYTSSWGEANPYVFVHVLLPRETLAFETR